MYGLTSLGFSFWDDHKWRYFRLVSGGRVLSKRGPVWMSDDEAEDEVLGMTQATIDQQVAAFAQRFDWVNGRWALV